MDESEHSQQAASEPAEEPAADAGATDATAAAAGPELGPALPGVARPWVKRMLAGSAAVFAIALLAAGAMWLQSERKLNSAMEKIAMSASSTAPPVAAAVQTAPVVPPVTTASPAQTASPAPAPAKAVPASTPVPQASGERQADLVLPPAATPARAKVRSKPLHASARPGTPQLRRNRQRANTVVARAPHGRSSAIAVRTREPSRTAASPMRCNRGDLARECLADMCDRGRGSEAACRAYRKAK